MRKKLLQYSISLLAFFLIWELVVHTFNMKEYFLPAPSIIILTLVGKIGLLLDHAFVTVYEIILGFIVGAGLGIFIAFLIAYSKYANALINPLLVLQQPVPKTALAPIILLWFGYGIISKIVMIFLISFFPVVVSTLDGLLGVDADKIDLMRSMKASKLQIFRKMRFPNSLPYVFTGLKISILLAIVGAIVAEFVGAEKGIGYLIVVANYSLQVPLMFACLIILAVMGLALYGVILMLEKRFIPWHMIKKEYVQV